jgi:hypothetical protein
MKAWELHQRIQTKKRERKGKRNYPGLPGIGERSGGHGEQRTASLRFVVSVSPAFENCNAFPPLVYLFIYNIFLPRPISAAASIHERERARENGMSTPNSKGTLHTWRPVMQQQQQQETHIMALISICVPLPEGPEARMWALPAVHAAMDPDVSVRSRSRLGRACMQQSA